MTDASETTAHPLDPLSADEIRAAVCAVREAHPELDAGPRGMTVPLVSLVEPPKHEVVEHRTGGTSSRRAHVVVRDRDGRRTFEAGVDLAAGPVVDRWVQVEDACPSIAGEDAAAAEAAVLADPAFVAALHRRGVHDLGMVQIDPLAPGTFPQNPAGRRIVWATPYLRPASTSNPYARPVENLRAAYDIDSGEVLEVLDGEVVPLSTAAGDYTEEDDVGGWRTDLEPLEITQPAGVSFAVDGHVVTWQNWRLHVALHPVDGWCSATSATGTATRGATSCTGRTCRKWWCPTANRTTASTGAPTSTPASTALGARRIR